MPTTYILLETDAPGTILRVVRTYESSDRAEQDKALLEELAGNHRLYRVTEVDHVER